MNTLRGKKILVFGGGGRLGSDLIPLLKAGGASIIAPSSKSVDIASRGVWECVAWESPDIVINLAAYTDVAGAESPEGRDKAVRTNILGSKYVCDAAHYFKCKVVYISTDYVYPGLDGKYCIEDASPCCSYATTKYVGEWFCKPDDLVIRTSMKARGTWGKSALKGVFHPVWTNADWVDVIAEKIVEVIADERVGIINLGTEKKLLKELAVQEYPDVEVIDVDDVDLPYKYPRDCSMILDY